MPMPIYARFLNQIYHSADHLYEVLSKHPYCVDPESNFFLHQFEGLALHCNHFAERNGLRLDIDNRFVDLANSIKHIRNVPERQISLQSAILFEINNNGEYRFIRNTILGKYINIQESEEFDAIEEMHHVILSYIPILDKAIEPLEITESIYPFYDRGFGYIDPILSVHNRGTRINTVMKSPTGYIRSNPVYRKFALLNASVIGKDPTLYFEAPEATFLP